MGRSKSKNERKIQYPLQGSAGNEAMKTNKQAKATALMYKAMKNVKYSIPVISLQNF